MKMRISISTIFIWLFSSVLIFCCTGYQVNPDQEFVTYIVNPQSQQLKFYWKEENDKLFKSIGTLKEWLEKRNTNLLFAMNGGMYDTENKPLGLFIENGETKTKLNTAKGNGNFYLVPNGVFYLTNDKKPVICSTPDFKNNGKISYATQSGPLLVINGVIHPAFTKGSANLNIRNGVGILPNNELIFAMSKQKINFYDFANYFKEKGCKYALYLDGFVSRAYLPQQNWVQTDGDFGVIIGVTEKTK
jgi:uncharacterized protein YigE (DUF2233 family)